VELIGTRIPDVCRGHRRGWAKWDRQRGGVRRLVAPTGAYMRVLNEDGSTWCWYIRDPTGDASSIREHHQVTEHADGTITVAPSIVVRHGNRWHGWLQAGVWTGV
jgi:Family of unknown function (DUF6527)